MKLTAAILALYAPSLSLGLVRNEWSFEHVHSHGMKDITFPFNMANVPPVTSGYAFIQLFNVEDVPEPCSIGLAPRGDAQLSRIVHATFNSFQGGTTFRHNNCHSSRDGLGGVRCATDIHGDYNHDYYLTVERVHGTTWRGSLTDGVTRLKTVIGEWDLPKKAGRIKNGQNGIVVYEAWKDVASPECGTLPRMGVVFGNPTSHSGGAKRGRMSQPNGYGYCVGKIGLTTSQTEWGWNVTMGS